MNGRVYDPVLGRFVTADPIIPGATDPRNHNRRRRIGEISRPAWKGTVVARPSS
jgi:hypothetical protein